MKTKEMKLCWKPKHAIWCANWVEGDEYSEPKAEGEAGETPSINRKDQS